jgi:hypothetical protein
VPGKALQELLEPFHALGVEVVGRLVEQQQVGLGQQQPAERDAALLAAGEHVDLLLPRRQAQRVGRDLQLVAPPVLSIASSFGLLLGQLVEVGVGLRVRGVTSSSRFFAAAVSPRASSTLS